jgi:hypothetical protein
MLNPTGDLTGTLSFQLLQNEFTQLLRVISSLCSAVSSTFLELLEEIWPNLFLFSGASISGTRLAKSYSRTK